MLSLNRVGLITLLLSSVLLSACSSSSSKQGPDSTDLQPLGASQVSSKADKLDKTHATVKLCAETYRVKWGDTLSEIAQTCALKTSELARYNGISKPYAIRVKQMLKIPTPANMQAWLKQSDSKSSSTFLAPTKSAPQTPASRLVSSKVSWQWPMKERYEFRYIRDTAGITGLLIEVYPGMPVLAVADGEVVYAGDGIEQFGWMVMIKHASGHMSVYAHNNVLKVKEGQQVKAGSVIALTGSTGLTDRPKLYVEARYHGKKVSIRKLLK